MLWPKVVRGRFYDWAIGSRADLKMYVSFIDEHTQLQKASRYLGAALLIYNLNL